jgi:hypothetical protein
MAPSGRATSPSALAAACGRAPGCQDGYHTYSIVLDRRPANQQLRWYLDGRQFYAVSESQVGTAAWVQAYDHGLSVLFDLAIGGGYPDSVCACTTPTAQTSSGATLSVRSVTVYSTTPGLPFGGTASRRASR